MRNGQGWAVAAAVGAMIFASGALAAPQPSGSTPRTAEGHPDFTGLWRRTVNAGVNCRAFANVSGGKTEGGGETTKNQTRDGSVVNGEIDAEFIVKSSQDMPQYKPEMWDKVRNFEEFAYRRGTDPDYGCKNPGVVRLAAPAEVFQSPNKITMIYTGPIDDGTSGHLWVREVPTDGRPLPKPDDYEGLRPTGTSVGHWEGDTLVIETVDFPDGGVWYATRGWVGSGEAKVTERLTRHGDILDYDITV